LATLAVKTKSNREVRNGFAMERKVTGRETHSVLTSNHFLIILWDFNNILFITSCNKVLRIYFYYM